MDRETEREVMQMVKESADKERASFQIVLRQLIVESDTLRGTLKELEEMLRRKGK
jgi:hypothetical protein